MRKLVLKCVLKESIKIKKNKNLFLLVYNTLFDKENLLNASLMQELIKKNMVSKIITLSLKVLHEDT